MALKVPNPGVMTDAKRGERFLREAKAAANLRHPHIVPVFDAGKDGAGCYIASAFIGGRPLSDTIEEKGTDLTRAARIAYNLAAAMAYAHEQGIVHRDVKPANVMVDKQESRSPDGLRPRGAAGGRGQTHQRRRGDGNARVHGPRAGRRTKVRGAAATGQYAVGVVLYELLTGTVSFAVVIHNVIHIDPDPPRKHRTYIPRDLETICLKAMAKRPEKRYAGCQALADDLRRWREGGPAARPLRPWERVARWIKEGAEVGWRGGDYRGGTGSEFRPGDRVRPAHRRSPSAGQEGRGSPRRGAAEEEAVEKTLGALGTASEERRKAEAFLAQANEERTKADTWRAKFEEGWKKAGALQVTLTEERKQAVAVRAKFEEERTKAEAAFTSERENRFADFLVTLEGHTAVVVSASFSPDGSRVVTSSGNEARVWDAKTGPRCSPSRASCIPRRSVQMVRGS